jgi:hypothetical protein
MCPEQTKSPSEAVDQRHLELARAEGEAYQRAVRHMATEVAHDGGQTEMGGYVVGYALEEAEGLYVPDDEGSLEWVEPAGENCHLEVAVGDAADGRFVPGLDVTATLTSADGEQVGPVELPLLWHPGLYHYGANLTVPGDGTYELRIRIEPAPFMRHDRENGDRYAEATEVVFDEIDVETGQS